MLYFGGVCYGNEHKALSMIASGAALVWSTNATSLHAIHRAPSVLKGPHGPLWLCFSPQQIKHTKNGATSPMQPHRCVVQGIMILFISILFEEIMSKDLKPDVAELLEPQKIPN